jgi:hypothetical protein
MAGDDMAVQLTQAKLLVRAARRLDERTARVKPARVRRVRSARQVAADAARAYRSPDEGALGDVAAACGHDII